MEVAKIYPTGESILRTLIELLEAQENIKITYQLNTKEGKGESIKFCAGVNECVSCK